MNTCRRSLRPGRRSRWAALLLAIAVGWSALLAPSEGEAGPALVFDVRSGEVLHAYGAYTPWHPASLTKLMTAYVAFDAVRSGRTTLESPVRISEYALSQPPSKMGFAVGTELSLEYALRILMVKSANDIAVAVGESISGSEQAFVTQMNSTARRLGMIDTYFVNPHGLHDPAQRTTARDMGVLARALIRDFPQYQRFFEIESIRVGQAVMNNHNKLIGRFQGADGMKTGYVCASGFNIVATATRGGRRLVAVVLGGMTSGQRNEVTAGLLEAGFAAGTGSFGLFSGNRTTLDSLHRPVNVGAPVDVRPYVCEKKKAPPEILSFGTEATAVAAKPADGDASRIVGNAGGGVLALASAPVVGLPATRTAADPLVAFDVPLPRPRPSRDGLAVAPAAAAVTPVTTTAKPRPMIDPLEPRPNPLR